MRTELQLVEFDRGEYLRVPVAPADRGAILINQLIGNQFATKIAAKVKSQQRSFKDQGKAKCAMASCRNYSTGGTLRRSIVVTTDQSQPLPVIFGSPVEFDVPIR